MAQGDPNNIIGYYYVVPPKYLASNIKVIFKDGTESPFTSQGWVYPELPNWTAGVEGIPDYDSFIDIFEPGAVNFAFYFPSGFNQNLQLVPNPTTNSVNGVSGGLEPQGPVVSNVDVFGGDGGINCFNLPLYCISMYNSMLQNLYNAVPAMSSNVAGTTENLYGIANDYYNNTYIPFFYDALGLGPNASGCCQNANPNARTAPDTPIDPPTIPPPDRDWETGI